MSTDIRLYVGFWSHHKTVKLERRLGLEGVKALLVFWLWTAQNRPTGILAGMEQEDVEISAGWTGEAGKLFASLLELHWIDDIDGVFQVHGWAENQPWASGQEARTQKARRAAQARWMMPEASGEHAPSNADSMNEHCPSPLPSSPLHALPKDRTTKDTRAPGADASHPKEVSMKFRSPSLAEIEAYCAERKSPVDPVEFFAFYEASNWHRGKTKITNWKQCLATWEAKRRQEQARQTFMPGMTLDEKLARAKGGDHE